MKLLVYDDSMSYIKIVEVKEKDRAIDGSFDNLNEHYENFIELTPKLISDLKRAVKTL